MPYAIHGLECDRATELGDFWPMRAYDFGVSDFAMRPAATPARNERFMVTLPMGTGLGDTFEAALRQAKQEQHAALWGQHGAYHGIDQADRITHRPLIGDIEAYLDRLED